MYNRKKLEKNEFEIFCDFYQQKCSQDITQEQENALKSIIEQALKQEAEA